VILAFGLLVPTGARAEEAKTPDVHPELRELEEDKFPWGAYLGAAGAVQNPAAAFKLGGRYRVGENFQVGLGGEWNPLFSKDLKTFRTGMANAYASFIFRMPTGSERLSLRSSFHLGTSTLLFDVYGAGVGSTGIFGGLNLLGLDYEFGKQLYFILDPADIAIAAPHLRGAPFVYSQYRVTLGIQWGS
jgi:hypothetical protein